ncbi:hypothetical protein CFP56_011087 [Quercus suber]|uniref:Uncharacterized protein n=1 Tax=Quercus suber TaxID=58331 RepID=A0AAW0KZ68_QUESU
MYGWVLFVFLVESGIF